MPSERRLRERRAKGAAWFGGWAPRVFLVGLGVAASLTVLRRLAGPEPESYWPLLALWILAIVAIVAAVPGTARRRRRRRFPWAIAAILMLALGVRGWNLESIPYVLGGDEASQGLEAARVLSGEIRNPFSTGWYGVPTLQFFGQAAGLAVFGQTATALRLPWALVGTLSVLLFYLLARRLHGRRFALLASSLLATYHFHVHFSRLGSHQIGDAVFVTGVLLALVAGRVDRSPRAFAWAGVTTGLSLYTYAGSRFAAILLVVALAWWLWSDRHIRARWQRTARGALIAGFAFLVTASPILRVAWTHPEVFHQRINQTGILTALRAAAQKPELPVTAVSALLGDQAKRAFLAWNFFPDRTVWYGTPRSAMDGLWAVLFVLGLFYGGLRVLRPPHDLRPLGWLAVFCLGTFLGSVLTESPPSYMRLVAPAVAATYFVALALHASFNLLPTSPRTRSGRAVITCVVVGLLAAQSLRWYFFEFSPMRLYGSRHGEIATHLGNHLRKETDPDRAVVFLGAPAMYVGFPTIPYLAPWAARGIDVLEPLTASPSRESLGIAQGQQPVFFAMPWRASELDFVAASFPGGTRRHVLDSRGQLLYVSYEPRH